ncbi:MAG: tRNA-dihydrouridine synthase family protein, partial [Opitutales bacterium]|nr:tRNA-dihydrouridine synthase family protein [Opitutales bacterium]
MPDFLKKGDIYLAPMSGCTDAAFRQIARENGADVCVSEFVHARAVLSKAPKILEKIKIEPCERPCGVQLFGGDEFEMADAAAFVEENFAPDFIDINCGCPAPNAVDAGAGASLLKDVPRMEKIARRVKLALKKIPLTAKMRTGWGADTILPGAALRLEDAGVEAIALHGRSKIQGYRGEANWNLIESTAKA